MKTETIVGLFVLAAIGIFFYLTFTIGSFRFDTSRYDIYGSYFSDVSGLELKDPVRIAGVTVGAVKEIALKGEHALVWFWVQKKYKLGNNALAVIQQQGLLGNKHVEIDPGDSRAGYLIPGGIFKMPSQSPPTMTELINKFGDIATSVQTVASSLQGTLGSREGEEDLRMALKGFARASDRIANFSTVLERTLKKNEQNLDQTLKDIGQVSASLSKHAPQLSQDLGGATAQLNTQALPAITDASNQVSSLSHKIGGTVGTFEDAAIHAREGLREVEQVVGKVNTGKGLLGKIINEDETYEDFRRALKSLKDYTGKLEAIDVMVDMHNETMLRDWNSKGYLNVRLRPTSDYFYNIQLVADEKGTIHRERIETKRFDCQGQQLCPPTLSDQFKRPDVLEVERQTKNDILFGFQFGKRFNRLAFRIGLFENTFGMGVDFYVPMPTNSLHWITTLELFDMKGVNRLHDNRPHLKWINRVYFLKHMYTTFGLDDIVSKRDANPFFGGGFRFNDKDLKYVLSNLPLGSLVGGAKASCIGVS